MCGGYQPFLFYHETTVFASGICHNIAKINVKTFVTFTNLSQSKHGYEAKILLYGQETFPFHLLLVIFTQKRIM